MTCAPHLEHYPLFPEIVNFQNILLFKIGELRNPLSRGLLPQHTIDIQLFFSYT